MKKGRMNIVMGGQAGSEAKGKQSAYLVDKFGIKTVVGNLSPNAGHTVIKDGVKHVTYHIPVGVYGGRKMNEMKVIMGPASIINPEVFMKEMYELDKSGFNFDNIYIDSRAVLVTPLMLIKENQDMVKIGSTAQGVGEARCSQIMRVNAYRAKDHPVLEQFTHYHMDEYVLNLLENGHTLLYEMSQGFDLCMLHGIDPVYCTSRNCTPMQALADMGVPSKWLGDVYAVIRPYPIRVNNRTGTSGPYPSEEITWDVVRGRCGAPHDITEMTTTTKLKRRVFEFSMEQIKRMVRICDPDYLCLQFGNYIDWNIYGESNIQDVSSEVAHFIKDLIIKTGRRVAYIGTGPDHGHMIDLEVD